MLNLLLDSRKCHYILDDSNMVTTYELDSSLQLLA
jgi:hypothetical protein